MERLTLRDGTTVSYERAGSGPPLVLVHGAFSDHESNWMFVKPLLRTDFTLVAIARRGRGETDATIGHTVEDEAKDVAAVIRSIGEPVHLLGHSYGAHCALAAAALVPDRIRRLVLYEAPWPDAFGAGDVAHLERLAADDRRDELAAFFFRDMLSVPAAQVEALRATEDWVPILADAPAAVADLRALTTYRFDTQRFRDLRMPVLLQFGSDSPAHLYVTDALARLWAHARLDELPGQAHEGMTTAPELYARTVRAFLHADAGGTPVSAAARAAVFV